jgi:hypothetical protein
MLYARPFERRVDDEVLTTYLEGDWWIQVATPPRTCFSWESAHQVAIALMQDADARRTR